jgi:hypothetical protein
VLFTPASVYRDLARSDRSSSWVIRPLLLAFVLGCTVSLGASGRLSLRLIADGALSFAFLPAFSVIGFAIVYHLHRQRPVPFWRGLDAFLTGQLPWLLWLFLLAAVCAVVEPRRLGPWILPLELSVAIPVIWSSVADFTFFREVMGRTGAAAVRDLLLYRALAWGAATAYFFGIAIWGEVVPAAIGWLTR